MIKQIIISAIVSVAILIGFVSFYPLFQNDNLGIANLTDITSGSTVSDFPAVYTANNTALEGAINTIEGTTTISTLTTASNLVTVGALASGSLAAGFTDVPVAQGGTGASTFTQYQLLFGSSTNPLISLGSIGTNGQFLTSSGAGALPTWTTSSINQSLDYSFTSSYFGVDNLFASSSVSVAGVAYTFPSSDGASSTVLATDASGGLTWNPVSSLGAGHLIGATSTNSTLSDSEVETQIGAGTLATLNGNILGTTGAMKVKVYVSDYVDSTASIDAGIVRVNLGGTQVCIATLPYAITTAVLATVDFTMINNGSASSQYCFAEVNYSDNVGTIVNTAYSGYFNSETTSSVDTTSDKVVQVTMDWSNNGAGTETITISGAYVQILGI